MNDRRIDEQSETTRGGCPLERVCGRLKLSHLGLLVLVFGLLLWARFLLVTGHPRTAIAEPAPGGAPQHAIATEPLK